MTQESSNSFPILFLDCDTEQPLGITAVLLSDTRFTFADSNVTTNPTTLLLCKSLRMANTAFRSDISPKSEARNQISKRLMSKQRKLQTRFAVCDVILIPDLFFRTTSTVVAEQKDSNA